MCRNDSNHKECDSINNVSSTMSKNMCGYTGVLTACLLVAACDNADVPVLPDEANDRVSITNNLNALNARVAYSNEDIAIDSQTPAALKLPSVQAPAELQLPAAAKRRARTSFKLVSQVKPPTVDGQLVQATSVTLTKKGAAIISYNMRGAARLGAVDWINRSADDHPKLTSGIIFADSDINAVNSDGDYVYTAVATNSVDYPFPAVMERMKIKYRSTTLKDNVRAPLTSFAATSVLPVEDVVYATSGDQGGVYAFNAKDLKPLGEFPLHDARWVAEDEDNGRLVVAQGTPGMLSVFEEGVFPGGSMNLINTFSFPGANIAESKSTVEVVGGKAFIAAGPEGVQIMCLDDGSIIGSVPRPDPASLGLDPSVVVTNAVSVDDDLMFISNGEAGVYVARGSEDFDKNNCATQNITMLGKMRFGDLQSANHVAYKSHYLYIAAGLGGIKVVKVKIRD